MLQSKECAYINIKKYNKKFLSFCYTHHQILSVNTVLNINELINLSELILKIKSVKVKSVKNVTDTVNNIINISALLK